VPWGAVSSDSRSTEGPGSAAAGAQPAHHPRLQALEAEVDAAVQEVNGAYQTSVDRRSLIFKRHHEHRDIWPFYRHATSAWVHVAPTA